jgi:hypothetical protein
MNRSEFQTYAEGCHGSITARSLATGNHYTFKFRQSRSSSREDLLALVLTDGDKWQNLGYVDFATRSTRLGQYSQFSRFSPCFQALAWLVKLAEFNPAVVEVMHDGRCGRCGRPLTHPDSIQAGIGPICAQRP